MLRIYALCMVLCLSACQSTTNKADRQLSTSNQVPSNTVLNYTKSDADYKQLINDIRANKATSQSFDQLIQIYPLTSFYRPTNSKEQAAKLLSQAQMGNQQWQDCLQTNQQLLSYNYTSLTGHYGASVCAVELGNIELGRIHNKVLDGLIEAIWRTGDGKTPQTPLYITSANDLYAFVQLHQLVVIGQSLTYVDELPVQVINIQNPQTNRRTTWYFDVTPQFRKGFIDELEK